MKNILIGLGEPNEPELLKAMDAEDEWFIQKLDHFNHTDNRTWKQVINRHTMKYKSITKSSSFIRIVINRI